MLTFIGRVAAGSKVRRYHECALFAAVLTLLAAPIASAESGPGCEPVPSFLAGADGQLLVRIDPIAGEASAISNTGLVGVASQVGGLVYDPSTGTLYASDSTSGDLVTIDLQSGLAQVVGPTGFSDLRDLAIQPGSGVVYGVDGASGQLVTIDKATGSGTPTGISGLSCVAGLEFDAGTQALYGTDTCADVLIQINLSDGVQTPVGALGFGNVTALSAGLSPGQMRGMDADSGQLITVNLATGTGQLVGSLGFSSVASLAVDTSGGRLFAVTTELDALLRVDPASGMATTVRRIGGNDVRGLAFEPQALAFYGADASSHQLLRIDPRNGDSSVVGDLGSSMAGLAFHPSTHVLYGCDHLNGQLVQIDTSTAQVLPVGSFGSASISGLAFDDAGVLYGTDDLGTGLFTISTTTGAATLIGPFGLPGSAFVTGLGFDPIAQKLYGNDSASAQLLSIDRATGSAAVVGPTHLAGLQALSWVAGGVPPECRHDFRYTLVTRLSPSSSDSGDLPASEDVLSCIQPFYVEFWARDEGAENTGVTCAYADIVYESARVQVLNLDHTELFGEPVFTSGADNGAGRIADLGGCHLPGVPGEVIGLEPQWVCVARVQMVALPPNCGRSCSPSALALSSEAAASESSALGRGIVATDNIIYGSASPELHCTCLYDLTGDCLVNAMDLGVLAPSWRTCAGSPGYDPRADFDCSGCVAGGDIGFFATAWLRQCSDDSMVFPPCKGCGTAPILGLDGAPAGQGPSVQFAIRLAEEPSAAVSLSGDLPLGVQRVHAGQKLYAEFWMRDLDVESAGLVAGFADLHFAPREFRLERTKPSSAYALMASGGNQPGRVTGMGGVSVAAGSAPWQWVRVAAAELEALADTDTPHIWLEPSNPDPAARYGTGAVSPARIQVLQAFPMIAAGDLDEDGDVDQSDFGALQRCINQSGGDLEVDCISADLNGDNLVDARDLTVFQKCARGPAIAADINCAR